ncbi:hypothetical protein ENSA5_43110 [Enhygromyxa salina]|uniref:Endonuclease/exonuclease/phosphatase domain-containing protein n=1 Tax=Enhygromyxa salina TaxID=215803 RepID=A0A2S9XK74_9BACT|nr:hypothetical protein [Enhygromyxa salina]PRP93289.1 hypothetical protein ENSA5_43110 [Enhygromyxa salina]
MAAPLTINEVLTNRSNKIDSEHEQRVLTAKSKLQTISSSLSDSSQTTTINLPAKAKALTIVSWNVQTFEPGKSLTNPFVNRVINETLAALDVDVCVLLETRTDCYVNMGAIETGYAQAEGWAAYGGDDEEGDEDGERLDGLDGGPPLTYLQHGSDMTGKLWRPPKRIHVYDVGFAATCKKITDYASLVSLSKADKKAKLDNKKLTKKKAKKLTRLQKAYTQGNLEGAEKANAAQKKLARDYAFFPRFLKSLCTGESGPSTDWKVVLTAKRFEALRFYYDTLVLDNQLKAQPVDVTTLANLDPQHNWRVVFELKRCSACNLSLGSGDCDSCEQYGPYSLPLKLLRASVDEITFYRCSAQESYAVLLRPNAETFGPSSRGIWLRGKCAAAHVVASNLLMRAPDELITSTSGPGPVKLKAGRLLGYQDNTNKLGFYGRCPFKLGLELWLPGETKSRHVPMVAFHGPFGASTNAGIEIRAAAMKELIRADVGVARLDNKGQPVVNNGKRVFVPFAEVPQGMIIGDFNLDWSPGVKKPKSPQKIANQLYDFFDSIGFNPAIKDGIATSLITTHDKNQAWTSKGPATADFTSSAYDNCFIKGAELQSKLANAAVVDVIQMIADNIDDYQLPPDDHLATKFSTLSAKQRAFYIYHNYVSDHLPIVIDILVQPLGEGSWLLERLRAQKKALMGSTKVHQYEVLFSYKEMLDLDRSSIEKPCRTDRTTEAGRETKWIGKVVAHQDEHLVVACEIMRGHIGRFAWHPPGPPKVVAFYLKYFPVGCWVEATMLEANAIA